MIRRPPRPTRTDTLFPYTTLFRSRIDTVKAAMPGRWAGDPHVDLSRTCVTHHLHDLQRCRAAHDAVIDKDNALAVDEGTVCIVLQLHAQMADLVARLDEGAANIVGTDDPQFEGNARLLGIADRGRDAAVGNGNHIVGLDRIFDGKLRTDCLPDGIDGGAINDRVGA